MAGLRGGVKAIGWRKVALLLSLYFCQGMPYGLQVTALPIYLRESGTALGTIGLVQLLTLPWILKALWAPAVDRFGSPRVGRRKSWILPMQAGLGLCAALGAGVDPSRNLSALLGLVFLMNLFAATQDIAVDGLAVDLLRGSELGAGNAAQVVGYKLGMIAAGGLLVWVAGRFGWPLLFLGMAGLCLAALLFAWSQPEPPPAEARAVRGGVPLRETLWRLWAAARLPGAGWLLVFVGTYKLGESLVDAMYKPFLVDAGFSAGQLGLWLGTYGMVASVAGSLAGGWLPSRFGFLGALAISGVLRSLSVAAEAGLAAMGKPTAAAVIGVTLAEHAFGGMLTTALFAFMMSRVDPTIGATHYTLLASVEVLGKAPGSLAGKLAERMGYFGVFALGAALSFAFLLLLWPVRRVPPAARPGPGESKLTAAAA
jgi:PAT family beta-lactamase induction signal transducer AmpG